MNALDDFFRVPNASLEKYHSLDVKLLPDSIIQKVRSFLERDNLDIIRKKIEFVVLPPIKGSVEWFRKTGSRQATVLFTITTIAAGILTVANPILGGVIVAVSALALTILFVADTARRHSAKRFIALDTAVYSGLRMGLGVFSKKPKSEKQEPVILFLHGMLGRGSNGNWLLDKLKDKGHVCHLNMGTGTVTNNGYQKEIEKRAKKVEEYILKHFGKETPIIIVAHSRGGPIAFSLKGLNITHICTLGSPLNEKQHVEKAKFLKQLSEEAYKREGTKFLHIASKVDGIVPFHEALPFTEQERAQTECYDDLAHTDYCLSQQVVWKIRTFINNDNSCTLPPNFSQS